MCSIQIHTHTHMYVCAKNHNRSQCCVKCVDDVIRNVIKADLKTAYMYREREKKMACVSEGDEIQIHLSAQTHTPTRMQTTHNEVSVICMRVLSMP